jgi:hypothetical protein
MMSFRMVFLLSVVKYRRRYYPCGIIAAHQSQHLKSQGWFCLLLVVYRGEIRHQDGVWRTSSFGFAILVPIRQVSEHPGDATAVCA